MDCHELEELAGALALGAVPPTEAESARGHLESCPAAHRSIRELSAVAALLAEAAEPLEPPARLRARILAAVHAEATAGAPKGVAAPPSNVTTLPPRPLVSGESGGAAAARAPLPARPRNPWFTRSGWLAAAAVAALAAGLGAWNLQLRGDIGAERDARQATEQRLSSSQRMASALAGGWMASPFSAPAAARDFRSVRGTILRPPQGQPGRPMAYFEGLPAPAADRVYQLWAIRAGAAAPLNTFRPAGDGTVTVDVDEFSAADVVAITVEPGRQQQPSSAPVLTSDLSARRLSPLINFRPDQNQQ